MRPLDLKKLLSKRIFELWWTNFIKQTLLDINIKLGLNTRKNRALKCPIIIDRYAMQVELTKICT